ncbi:hypothetical protein PybrP1_002211 [[Pythium] brassicae (nom. inval.)]|nr:hypothetical protein PybrP1_002211 [[Pythium] brassicae (nom. inval.)]
MPTLVRILLKIGSIEKANRTSVQISEPMYAFNPTAQGYIFVPEQADARISTTMHSSNTKAERPDENLYLKPSIHAAQKTSSLSRPPTSTACLSRRGRTTPSERRTPVRSCWTSMCLWLDDQLLPRRFHAQPPLEFEMLPAPSAHIFSIAERLRPA